MITTVQCSICSQLNNKHRLVVTDFRLHHAYLQYNNNTSRNAKHCGASLSDERLTI